MRDGRIAQLGTPPQLYDAPNDSFVVRYLGAANLLLPRVAFAVGEARYEERERLACIRPESFRIVPLGEGQLHGTIASIEWYSSVLSVSVSVSVTPDAMPNEPVLISAQRGHHRLPEKGSRVSFRFEADDVVLVRP